MVYGEYSFQSSINSCCQLKPFTLSNKLFSVVFLNLGSVEIFSGLMGSL